jgi:hypothetical protein
LCDLLFGLEASGSVDAPTHFSGSGDQSPSFGRKLSTARCEVVQHLVDLKIAKTVPSAKLFRARHITELQAPIEHVVGDGNARSKRAAGQELCSEHGNPFGFCILSLMQWIVIVTHRTVISASVWVIYRASPRCLPHKTKAVDRQLGIFK